MIERLDCFLQSTEMFVNVRDIKNNPDSAPNQNIHQETKTSPEKTHNQLHLSPPQTPPTKNFDIFTPGDCRSFPEPKNTNDTRDPFKMPPDINSHLLAKIQLNNNTDIDLASRSVPHNPGLKNPETKRSNWSHLAMATNPTKLNVKVNQNNVNIFNYNPGPIIRTDPNPKNFTPNQTWSAPSKQFTDPFNNSAQNPQKNQNPEFIYPKNHHSKTLTQKTDRIKQKKDSTNYPINQKKPQNSMHLETGGFTLTVQNQNQNQNDVTVCNLGPSNKSPRLHKGSPPKLSKISDFKG